MKVYVLLAFAGLACGTAAVLLLREDPARARRSAHAVAAPGSSSVALAPPAVERAKGLPASAPTALSSPVEPAPGTVPAAPTEETRPDPVLVQRDLAGDDVERQRAALVAARRLLEPSLEADIEKLLARSEDVLVKQVGTQVLALGEAEKHEETFERLFADPDSIVRLNAAFGLARSGDAARQEWLLRVYDEAREDAPLLVPLLGEMLELPELRAPAVIARYEQVAQDPTQDGDLRARAAEIVRLKRTPEEER